VFVVAGSGRDKDKRIKWEKRKKMKKKS